jgi:hypothetical protein
VVRRILAFAMLIGIANAGAAGAQTASPVPTALPTVLITPRADSLFTHAPCALPNSPPEVIRRAAVEIPTKISETIGREQVRIVDTLDDVGHVVDVHASARIAALVPLGEKIGRATTFTPARHGCFPAASLVVFVANISGDGLQRPPDSSEIARPCTIANHEALMSATSAATAPAGAAPGSVKVEVQVDRNGLLSGATVIEGPKNLQRAALDEVAQASYSPETRGCQPRASVIVTTIPVAAHA